MKLHCLGTAGYHPNESRHTSCYFLEEHGIVLDAGSGLFRLRDRIRCSELDILLSHSHLDHVLGLTFLLDVLHESPVERLRIWGERSKLDSVRRHLFAEAMFPVKLKAEWRPIDEQAEFRIRSFRVSWRPQPHPGGSVAYRIEGGASVPSGSSPGSTAELSKSVVYATDTTGVTDQDWVSWAEGADLLMHECNFRDSQSDWAMKTGHCWPGRVAEVATATRPRTLLLTHINPLDSDPDRVVAEVNASLSGPCGTQVRLACDGDVIEF